MPISTQPGSFPSVLVIGYGNSLRGDDGAGAVAAEKFGQLDWTGLRVLVCHQLTPELAEPVARVDHVFFVDAAAGQSELCLIREISPQAVQGLGHHADPCNILALARELFGGSPQASLVTIAARSFELGERLSFDCNQGVELAVQLLSQRCRDAGCRPGMKG